MKNASSKITLLLLFAVASLFVGCATATTPLMQATEKGDTKEMERLIAEGVNINERGGENVRTPLGSAAWNGQIEAARLLIEKGADVNAVSGANWTPLYLAAYNSHIEVVRLLIKNGADPNIRGGNSKTPLDDAKERGHTSIVSLLENPKFNAKTDPSNPAEEAAFTEAAHSYRAATVKPTLPEEARKFGVQAEYAVKKMDFEGAVARYKEALDVAPWWPEGHFNRAMILSELSRYRDAIREMKKYLTLVPDASNARAAQDKIYQWEGELK